MARALGRRCVDAGQSVQMLDDRRIRVELVAPASAPAADFTPAARIYVR